MLKKRLALNLGANFFSQFTTVFSQIAVVPLFMHYWGLERYGVWQVVSSIPAYLTIADAGFANQAGNEMSMAVAGGNYEKARESLHTTWGFLLGISSVLLILIVITFFIFPWDHWLKLPGVTGQEIRWVMLFLSIYVIVAICSGVFEPIYRTVYRNPRCQMLSTFGRLLELVALCVSVILSHSMICLALAMLSTKSATWCFLWADSRRFSPKLHLGLAAFSKAELKRAWRPASMYMLGTMGNAFYLLGLTQLVAVGLGVKAVPFFTTMRTLTRSIVQFANMIRLAVRTEFSYLYGGGDLVRAQKLNELAFEASIAASIFFAAGIYITAPYFIPFWTAHRITSIDPLLLSIFLASAVLNGVWTVTSGLLMGINQHEGLMLRYVLAALLALGLGVATVHILGLYGVALAMVVCELVLVPYAIRRTCHLLHQPVKEFLYNAIRLKAVRSAISNYYLRRVAKAA